MIFSFKMCKDNVFLSNDKKEGVSKLNTPSFVEMSVLLEQSD